MKKIYLSALALIVTAISSNAQITTDPITGNVGIGTTNPQNKLDVTKIYTPKK